MEGPGNMPFSRKSELNLPGDTNVTGPWIMLLVTSTSFTLQTVITPVCFFLLQEGRNTVGNTIDILASDLFIVNTKKPSNYISLDRVC